jgi:hypothetical protein
MATSQGGSITILDNPWHPTITLAMVQQYDPSITALNQCVVLPDSWTGPPPGPPNGTSIPGSGTITLMSASASEPAPAPPPPAPANHGRRSTAHT